MNVTGKLIQRDEVQRGTSKTGKMWEKLNFVIQVKGFNDRKKFIQFSTFNAETIQFISDTNLESEISVEFDVESREWKGNWYTDCKAWKVAVLKEDTTMVTTQQDLNDMANDMAKGFLEEEPVEEGGDGDLPF